MTKKVALLTSMLIFVIIINNFQVIFLSELNNQLDLQNNENLTGLYFPNLSTKPLWKYSTEDVVDSVTMSDELKEHNSQIKV